MNKSSVIFECSKCGAQFQKWAGRCLDCGGWGSLVESRKSVKSVKSENKNDYAAVKTVGLSEIRGLKTERIKTSIDELDRVLGGGMVPGSLILLGGEPGVGKSTLALQLAAIIPHTLYFSGEESAEQIKLRADRLKTKADTLRLGATTNVESIIATIKSGTNQTTPSPLLREEVALSPPARGGAHGVVGATRLVIIDSIQTIHSDEVEGEAGNLNQGGA